MNNIYIYIYVIYIYVIYITYILHITHILHILHIYIYITKLKISQKIHFKITITDTIFVSASNNAVKGKIGINKSLIGSCSTLAIHDY